jgi:hypothetical protein
MLNKDIMNIILTNVNWFTAFWLGIVAIYFLWLGLRRGIRFFDHENGYSKKERLLDGFLLAFNISTVGFCVFLAISPIKLWLAMIPIGFAIIIVVIPVVLLGSYYHLFFVSGYMPKNNDVQSHHNLPPEKSENKMAWFEFAPFVFIVGWFVFFVINR